MNDAKSSERAWDIVLFGATGFVGQLIAEYLRGAVPEGLRWAIAGRSRDKLGALHHRLGDPAIGVLIADVDDPASLAAMAAATRVVLTTVGPYIRWGEPVARACVDAGAHYLDLTGEPAYVAGLIERHDRRARERGVALVPCCGYDSIPADLGAFYTVLQLPEGAPIRVRGAMQGSGSFSGGTVASALEIFSRPPTPGIGRTIAPSTSEDGRTIERERQRLFFERTLGLWLLAMPTIDPSIALRSAGMLRRYGPRFTYGHYVGQRWLPQILGAAAGGALFFGALKVPPIRRAIARAVPPGSGPSPERRAKSWFRLTFVGEGGGRRVITEVSGGDPGYDETAKMVGESAILLATRGPEGGRGGVLTPAVALGEALIERLGAVGIRFRRVEQG
ncbi:MAG: saccharopine dehydrogenase NADP-binding domain-containing protein [Myxococcales bacterium]|nr:saccharopine dehydrogenase NADP-binding domain-containing protein [Myxococcales bacterium]